MITQESLAQSMRFMDATAEIMADEHARHDNTNLQSAIEAQRRAGVTWDEEPTSLEEIGYGESWHDILDRDTLAELTGSPPIEVGPDVARIFEGNLLVENGHAEYDRINSEVFEHHPVFRAWKNTWVSDEKNHGESMQEWGKAAELIDIRRVHAATTGYLRHGLTLHFATAAEGLAYPAFQEPATYLTHAEVMRRLPKSYESLAANVGRRILANVNHNEREHAILYRNMVGRVFETEDVELSSQMMQAVARAALGFSMPGMESDIPGRKEINAAYRRTGTFTLQKVAREVLLPVLTDKVTYISAAGSYDWRIADRTALTDEAKAAQEELVTFIEQLTAGMTERAIQKTIIKARRTYGTVA